MQRRALIVAGAAGPEEAANAVLQRFGFAPATTATGVPHAAQRLVGERFDLVIVPLQNINPVDLATLEREVRKSSSTYVIGTAVHADPELIVRAMRSGIHEFLVFPPDAGELSGAIDRLLRRSHSESGRGSVTAVYSAKGGLGTTTVAINLAHGLAKNNPDARVALGDLVVGNGDVAVMLDLRPTYDIGDLLSKMSRVDADLLYSLLTPCTGGVWVLPSGERPEVADLLDGPATATMIGQLRSHFAFVVLDCEHHMSERTLAALDAADRVVVVTQLNLTALRSTQRALGLCRRLGYSGEKLQVVVNRHHPNDLVSPADAAELLEHEIALKVPNDYRTVTAALTKGVPAAEHGAGTQLAASYLHLAAALGGNTAPARNGAGRGSRLGRLLTGRRA